MEKSATLRIQICCCVKDAGVAPCLVVSRSVSDSSVRPSVHPPFSSPPQFLSGISVCKYCLIPPPCLLLSLSYFLPLLTSVLPLCLYQWPSFIPSHPLHACVPPTTSSLPNRPPPSPPSPSQFIPVLFPACTFPRPLPGSIFPQPSIPISLSSIFGWVSFWRFWCLVADLDAVILGLGNIH